MPSYTIHYAATENGPPIGDALTVEAKNPEVAFEVAKNHYTPQSHQPSSDDVAASGFATRISMWSHPGGRALLAGIASEQVDPCLAAGVLVPERICVVDLGLYLGLSLVP